MNFHMPIKANWKHHRRGLAVGSSFKMVSRTPNFEMKDTARLSFKKMSLFF